MFDVSIEQPVLIKALEYLEPTVGKNTKGLGDNCVSMRTTGNGSIEMYTMNTIECTCLEAIVSMGGNTIDQSPLMDFKRLKAIISTIPSNEIISMKASVNDLMISFGINKKPLKLVGCNNGMIPLPNNQFSSGSVVSIPKTVVLSCLKHACAIITETSASPIFNCISFHTNQLNIEATALDITGKRTFAETGLATSNNPDEIILVEANKLKKSMKLFEDFNELEFAMDSNIIRIQASDPVSANAAKTKGMLSNITYYCHRLTGAFPQKIATNFYPLPAEFIELSRSEIQDCFNRVKALEDQTSSNLISFEADSGKINIVMNSSYGSIEETINNINNASVSFKTIFKYPNIVDILKALDTSSTLTFEIGVMQNHNTNYIIRPTGSSQVMFSVPSMILANNSSP